MAGPSLLPVMFCAATNTPCSEGSETTDEEEWQEQHRNGQETGGYLQKENIT